MNRSLPLHAQPPLSYLLISLLEVVVGDPPVEVLSDILADSVHGLRAELLLHASVDARCSPQNHVEEAQLGEGFIKRMLILAPQPAPHFGAPDLRVAAERPLHVAHHVRVVAAVKRLHRMVIQEVVGLQKRR